MRKTIAVDMDGVLADTFDYCLSLVEQKTGERIDRKALEGKSEREASTHPALIRQILQTPGFFRSIPVMPGAKETMDFLNEHFELYICSAATEFPESLKEKFDWLQEHFPIIDWKHIIFCGNKDIVGTDYMIDDCVRNLAPFKGEGILFSAFYNRKEDQFPRVESWEEVKDYFSQVVCQQQ